MRVLIVDDHPSFLASAAALLRSEGCDVVGTAPDAPAAMAATVRLRPEVILVDVHLPEIDGFALTARLLAADARPVVVLISSRAAADFGPRIVASGAAGFLAKSDLCHAALVTLLDGGVS